jgi:hypothetical protein
MVQNHLLFFSLILINQALKTTTMAAASEPRTLGYVMTTELGIREEIANKVVTQVGTVKGLTKHEHYQAFVDYVTNLPDLYPPPPTDNIDGQLSYVAQHITLQLTHLGISQEQALEMTSQVEQIRNALVGITSDLDALAITTVEIGNNLVESNVQTKRALCLLERHTARLEEENKSLSAENQTLTEEKVGLNDEIQRLKIELAKANKSDGHAKPSCHRGTSCRTKGDHQQLFDHSLEVQVQARNCRYNGRCRRKNCHFVHVPCRDGEDCTHRDCRFTHPLIEH